MYTYKYPRAALTVDAIVYTRKDDAVNVLLIRRGQEPFKGKWALPGGFVQPDELLETACIRELQEETGLKVESMHQFKSYDAIDRDPRHRTISIVHYSETDKKEKVKGSDDAAAAKWFSIPDLPELAFDHREILHDFFSIIL